MSSSASDCGLTRRQLIVGGLSIAALMAMSSSLSAARTTASNDGALHMNTVTTKDGTRIFYKDWGSGQPIVFHHGWPLSADDWDAQMMFFLSKGYRVIAHDRRGHGRSTQTFGGNEMETYAADVAALVDHLGLKH